MHRKLHFIKYYVLVVRTAYSDTKEYYQKDRKSLIGNIITGVISGIASPILLYRFGGLDAISNFWLVSIVVLLSALIGAVGWLFVLFLWNIFVVSPVKLYREKESEADIYTWNGVFFEKYNFPIDSVYAAGLKVSTVRLTSDRSLLGEIVEIRQGRDKLHEDRMPIRLPVTWHKDNPLDWSLPAPGFDNPARFVITGWNNSIMWIISAEPQNRIFLEKNVEYKIRIRLHMDIGQVPLDKVLRYKLVYHNNSNGRLEMSFDDDEIGDI